MSGGLADWRWLRPLERGFGSFPKPLSGVPWVGNCLVALLPADTLLSMVTDVWGEMFTNLVDLKLCLGLSWAISGEFCEMKPSDAVQRGTGCLQWIKPYYSAIAGLDLMAMTFMCLILFSAAVLYVTGRASALSSPGIHTRTSPSPTASTQALSRRPIFSEKSGISGLVRAM